LLADHALQIYGLHETIRMHTRKLDLLLSKENLKVN